MINDEDEKPTTLTTVIEVTSPGIVVCAAIAAGQHSGIKCGFNTPPNACTLPYLPLFGLILLIAYLPQLLKMFDS